MKNRLHSSIEPLEARIAPAVVISGGGLVGTYTDVDGDTVTVKVSQGTLTAGMFTLTAAPLGEQLQMLDLSGGGFDDADLTVSVKKAKTGDGLVSVGDINSTMHDLGKVKIAGNLDQLEAGDAIFTDGSVASITANSLGKYGLSGSAISLSGSLGALSVKGDVIGTEVFVTGNADGKIGSVTIGGSLLGGAASFSGTLFAQGDIGPIKIGKDVSGGTGGNSGWIRSQFGSITSVSIGGSLIGGTGASDTGEIMALVKMGPVTIKGSIIGGNGNASGSIFTEGNGEIVSVTVGGSLKGGDGTGGSGQIIASGKLGPVKIGGDVVGGAGGGGGFFSGNIGGGTEITSISIAGSLLGGTGAGSGTIYTSGKISGGLTIGGSISGSFGPGSGAVNAGGDVGKVKIGKDIRGGTGASTGLFKTSNGNVLDLTVGGSVIGGLGNDSGEISVNDDLLSLTIKGSLIGGSVIGDIVNPNSLSNSGFISAKHFGKILIGGSVISGEDKSPGTLLNSGAIRSSGDIVSLTVKGSLIGNASVDGDSPVVISGRGQAAPGPTTDLAIGKLTVGGLVYRANILAGFDVGGTAQNGDAQIGPVSIGGDWIQSNLVAGVQNLGADDAAGGMGANADNVNFGDAHDVSIGMGSAQITASIASIQIKGLVVGSALPNDHFGFSAQKIGSFKALGFAATNPANTQLSFATGDASIRIV